MLWLMGALAIVTAVGSFTMAALIVAWFWLVGLALLLLSCVLTWPRSRRDFDRHWWSRWYAILLWAALGEVLSLGATAFLRVSYRPFYVASESMIPTLVKNEKLIADMRWRTPRIGNIVLIRDADQTIRLYRVAAVGGQTFEMRNGVPLIDNHPATQRPAGEMPSPVTWSDVRTGRLLTEHLPGEAGSHRILVLGTGAPNDIPPVRLPAGSIYLLGDDRDLAADSRVDVDAGGIGVMPASSIVGRPLYLTWSHDRSRIGQRADH